MSSSISVGDGSPRDVASTASHYPGIDGLRAAAVLVVVTGHAAVPGAGGAFLGVDVFFVISGFVITLTLLREFDRTGTVRLGQFYSRRFWRLTPALVLMIAFAGWFEISSRSISPWGFVSEASKALTYTYNLWWAADGTAFKAEMGLVHTWSLAVEEQFYLLWAPSLAVGLALFARRRARVTAALGLVVVFALLRVATVLLVGVEAGIRLPWTRLDELLLGAVLALALHGSRGSRSAKLAVGLRNPLVAGLAVAFLIVSVVSRPNEYGYLTALVGVPAACLASAVLIGHSYVETDRPSPVLAILSSPPAVWVGQRSYGIYLFHFPITYVGVGRGLSWPPVLILGALGAIGMAALSYRYIELPLQRYGRRRAARHTLRLTPRY